MIAATHERERKRAIRETCKPGTVPVTHPINLTLLRILEDQQIEDAETGQKCNGVLLPLTKYAMRRGGFNEFEIHEAEHEFIETAAMLPKRWKVTRDAPAALAGILKRQGRLHVLEEKRIVPVPNAILNALACEQLLKMFTLPDLLKVPGFVLRRVVHEDGTATTGLRIDIDPAYARAGFMIPIVNDGLILGFRVFRYPHDHRPFILKSRAQEMSLNA